MTTEKKKPYEGKKALQVFIDEETHAKFKALCSLRGTKMTEVTADLIEKWVAEQIKSTPWMK